MARDLVAVKSSALTPAPLGRLADMSPELQRRANLTNPKTRRVDKSACDENSSPACARLGLPNIVNYGRETGNSPMRAARGTSDETPPGRESAAFEVKNPIG